MGSSLTLLGVALTVPFILLLSAFSLLFGAIGLFFQAIFSAITGPPAPTPPVPAPTGPPPPSAFDISLVSVGKRLPRYDVLFERAAAKWESVVVGDLRDLGSLGEVDLFNGLLSNTSMDFNISFVDDLLIGYEFVDDLGDLALGRAGPVYRRNVEFTTVSGVMIFSQRLFDANTEANNYATVLHEMGHVLGYGAYFDDVGCDSGCQVNGQGAVYTCPEANRAYQILRASTTENFGPDTLRLSNDGGGLTQCISWEDDNFNARNWIDVMTPLRFARSALLTRVSVASLRDVSRSYVVNEAAADVIPRSDTEPVVGGIPLTNVNGALDNRGEVVLLKPVRIREAFNNLRRRRGS